MMHYNAIMNPVNTPSISMNTPDPTQTMLAHARAEIRKWQDVEAALLRTAQTGSPSSTVDVSLTGQRAPFGTLEKAILGVLNHDKGQSRAEVVQALKKSGYAYAVRAPHVGKYLQKMAADKAIKRVGSKRGLGVTYWLK